MTRKEKLSARAKRYANANSIDRAVGANGFEAGYLAAMKDLRKVIAEVGRETVATDDQMIKARQRAGILVYRVRRFAKPLR